MMAFISSILVSSCDSYYIRSFKTVLHFANFSMFLTRTVSKEWTRVSMYGSSPPGRYGHAVTMVGTKFFVFGGQVDGEFLNDLWSFDLNTCKSSAFISRPIDFNQSHYDTYVPHGVYIALNRCILVRTQTQWELCQPTTTDRPAQRTGHICVTHGDRIIVYVSFHTFMITSVIFC